MLNRYCVPGNPAGVGMRGMYILALSIGSFIGGFIPNLWGAGMFSMWGVFFSALGGIAGIWLVYKYMD